MISAFSFRRFCTCPRRALSVYFPLLILLLATAVAQEQSTGSQADDSSSTQQQQNHKANDSRSNGNDQPAKYGAQVAKESREAADEDETAEFKQSASVAFLARITGMSLKHAYWLAVVLNFAVVSVAIFWFSRKFLPGMFRDRTAAIQKAIEEARKASADANRRLSEIEARLSKLDVEIGSMRAAAEREALAEEQRIKATAEEDTRKIIESAEQEIAAAAKQARRELTAYAADLAVSLAQRQIHVDAATDQVLVRSFADQLSGMSPSDAKLKTGTKKRDQ